MEIVRGTRTSQAVSSNWKRRKAERYMRKLSISDGNTRDIVHAMIIVESQPAQGSLSTFAKSLSTSFEEDLMRPYVQVMKRGGIHSNAHLSKSTY